MIQPQSSLQDVLNCSVFYTYKRIKDVVTRRIFESPEAPRLAAGLAGEVERSRNRERCPTSRGKGGNGGKEEGMEEKGGRARFDSSLFNFN